MASTPIVHWIYTKCTIRIDEPRSTSMFDDYWEASKTPINFVELWDIYRNDILCVLAILCFQIAPKSCRTYKRVTHKKCIGCSCPRYLDCLEEVATFSLHFNEHGCHNFIIFDSQSLWCNLRQNCDKEKLSSSSNEHLQRTRRVYWINYTRSNYTTYLI